MALKKEGLTYEDVVRDVRDGHFKPFYYLMGEEPYYIDRISDYIVERALKEEERDFNLTILYGNETTVDTVINAAKRYPMMAERQVVVVREAQNLPNKEALSLYLQHPQPSTVLVLCHKHGTLDRRKKPATDIAKYGGVLFESKRLYDSQLPGFVTSYLRRKKIGIEQEAALLLCESVGSNLDRLVGEMDKLVLALPGGEQRLTAELIERHTGISKEFNNFELVNALVVKDVFKANRIVNYLDSNPKSFALPLTLTVLFNFFSNLMLAYYAPQRTEEGIAEWIGQPRWQVTRNIIPAMRNYSGVKVMQIIGELRVTDARSKGVDNPNTSSGELLKQLIYFILHG